ncbi:siroheme synthase CysG [Qingshengfaniella alkalisoli]|uniref:Uroporphyrinogen-III C-methyltransferase n=1 Tax=Qingshengfaniella alkalisoli TaxID=2599296 RepID=A0A5B8I873_9RHOB|nr:siroheme synthase CysG [Qingshengfaniella alkalisoli]QDY68826.1 uroporphyrinogen-III C-methyltransferase [Qingshengfaniella alkalisoli]
MKTFPMFLKMADRRVVIAGGGEQAAQKARLILKTEARIVFLAPCLEAELQAIVNDGRAEHVSHPPGVDDFRDAALVFVATGDAAQDVELHNLAKAAGVVVNVVDRPELCDALTPSIVDRDPVVVAIGTEGTAPVLGRMIKTQIETMLEPRLGGLAALAGRMRDAVAAAIPDDQRRAFWRWVFQEAPRNLHKLGRERDAARSIKGALAKGRTRRDAGMISLVGAGPGSADLLTLRAVQRLQEADIIFYDRLVHPDVLELARRDAERVFVGKAVGACEWPQDRIDRVVIAAAREGKRVVRLKSGDPSIFGRAEEELRAADEAGLATEIVPGITAASAAAGALGHSLTERGVCDRLMLTTATLHDGSASEDWATMMRPGCMTAFYMGTRKADQIRSNLLASGVPADAPVHVVASASLPDEKQLHSTVGQFANDMARQDISNPAVILVQYPYEAAVAKAPMIAAE